jgi:tetratricopeptide (TPR) repeat protein
MSYDIIPLIIIVLCLVGIIIIVVRKFPALAAIDISAIQSEKEAETKEKIIAERLERKTQNLLKRMIFFISPFRLWLKNQFKKIYDKVLELEKYYQKKQKLIPASEDTELKIKKLLFEVEELIKENKLKEAEEKYIEIISLDPKNLPAYEGLGNLYLEEKNYDYARETFKHILKLKTDDVDAHISLGLIYKALKENKKAQEFFKKAVALEPNNPRSLDFLLEISIILGNKSLAKETFEKLKEVNPENQKLVEFEEKIKEIK